MPTGGPAPEGAGHTGGSCKSILIRLSAPSVK